MRLPCNRGGFRTYLVILGLLAGQVTPFGIAVGSLLLLVGITLRLWAKGCLHQNRDVTTSGPYRFVRHPFYLGNIFVDLAIVAMSGSMLLMIVFPVWWCAVYLPTMRREETALRSLFGRTYEEYANRVPLLFPFRSPLPVKDGFSWRNPNILRTELPRTVRFLSYPLLFMLCRDVSANGFILHSYLNPAVSYALFGVVLLNGIAWQLRRSLRCHRSVLPACLSIAAVRGALLAGIIVLGAFVIRFEVECDWVAIPPGVALIGLSLFLHQRKPQDFSVAEAPLLIGFAFLCELPWLSLPIIFIYSAIFLDERLTNQTSTCGPGRRMLNLVPISSTGYYFITLALLLISVTKELVIDVI